jgi:hypothetical protein
MVAEVSSLPGRSTQNRSRRPFLVWVLVAALVLQGVGALGGGIPLLLDTSGETLGLSTDTLTGTPVTTYLLPGLLLVIPLGLLPLIDSWALVRKPEYRWALPLERSTGFSVAWWLALAIGIGLIVWIVVEYFLIDYQWLQALYGLLGVLIVLLTLLPRVRHHYSIDQDQPAAAGKKES